MTDTMQPPDVSAAVQPATAQPSPAPIPVPTPAPPSVAAGSEQPPTTSAPPSSGGAAVVPTPTGGQPTGDQEQSHFSKVAHNIFQALAGGPQRTLDENGNWQTKQLSKGGIARGVIAGALAGMFAGVQRGPGKYPGGPVEAFGKGGQAGFALTQFQREQQIQNQKIKQDAMLKQAQIYEANSRNMLNEANLTKANLENNKDAMLLNQMMLSQVDSDPSNMWGSVDKVHNEDELKQGVKDGKIPPGSVLGVKIGTDENGGLYKVVANPDAKFKLTPQMYDMAATIHPSQFPLIHKDGTSLTDSEKGQTWTVGDFQTVLARGIGGYDIPNQYLGVIKDILKNSKDDLADKVPDKIDPKYMPAWLQAQRLLAYSHMTGKGPTAILDNLDAINPMTNLPAIPENVKNQIYASIGGGNVAMGREILQAEQVDLAAKAKAKQSAAERQSQLENPKSLEEVEARLQQFDPNDPDTDAEYNRLTKLRDSMIKDAGVKAGTIAKQKGLEGGSDYDSIMQSGYGKISHKTLAMDNSATTVAAPDSFLVNIKTGLPVPLKLAKTFSPTPTDKQRATFANSAIKAINAEQEIVEKGMAMYGPVEGTIRSWLVTHGLDTNPYDTVLQNYQTMAKSASTGAHVGGRFNIPILDEMDRIMANPAMNYQQFQALVAIKDIMGDYSRNGGLMTVGMWKRMTPNQQAAFRGENPNPPAGWQGHLKEGVDTPFTQNGKTEYWTLQLGRPKIVL